MVTFETVLIISQFGLYMFLISRRKLGKRNFGDFIYLWDLYTTFSQTWCSKKLKNIFSAIIKIEFKTYFYLKS